MTTIYTGCSVNRGQILRNNSGHQNKGKIPYKHMFTCLININPKILNFQSDLYVFKI